MAEEMIQGYASLQRRIAAIKGPVLGKDIMNTLAHASVNESKNIVTHKTSNLSRSIHVGTVTDMSAEVVASANYALFVEENTRPHEIRPTHAAALAWATTAAGSRQTGSLTAAARRGSMGLGGKIKMLGVVGPSSGPVQFAKVVHHPGTTGQHYMRKGAEAAIKGAGLLDRVIIAWNKAG